MRKRNTLINIFSGIGGQLLTQLFAFIVRTFFIYSLGSEYLGINGLFTNILSLLSLAELGIGSAITYYLYKPLANKNFSKISAYMKFYKKVYTLIGIFVFVSGLVLMPFLDLIIKDMPNIENLYLIYFLFLVNTAVSYFFSYYTTLLVADQKQYKTIITTQIIVFIRSLIQIYILIIHKDYLLYLNILILSTLANNYIISKIAKKEYREVFEDNCEVLSKEDLLDLKRYISATFLHKIGSLVVFNTDNLLISSFVGISYVGITSNYYLIIQMISTFIGQIFNGMIASIGNLNSENDLNSSFEFYKIVDFFVFSLYTICTVVLLNVITPFIIFWIGDDYLLSVGSTFLIIFNFYLTGLRKSNIIFIDTMGLQWITRKKPIVEAVVNFVVSIVLLYYFGLIGVFLGTLISTVCCSFFYEPIVLYKYGFKRKFSTIYIRYVKYFFAATLSFFITNFILLQFDLVGFYGIICGALISAIVPIILIVLLWYKSDEFKYFNNLFMSIIRKRSL